MLPRDYTAQENLIARVLTEMGIRYEQQTSMGDRYIVDFLCVLEGIVVEADGPFGHLSKADRKRDEELLKLGVNQIIHIKSTTKEGIRKVLDEELACQE